MLPPISPWAPLRLPLFRAFWLASLVSNLGTWVHEVGAGWLMTSLDGSPEMVSAVRTAMAMPLLLLAIPAGVLADRVDRRQLLLATQCVLLLTAVLLAVISAADAINAWGLLFLTFVIGLGMVIHVPTWQASVPELVHRTEIPAAVALGSISFNLARAVGPALGGVMVATAGAWSAFALNAASFAAVICVLLFWRREKTESTRGLSFGLSLVQGLRYVVRTRMMRHALVNLVLFVLPASALWSLLPLLAREQLNWDSRGFGLLVTSVGLGAILAATVLPKLIRRFGKDITISLAMLLFTVGLVLLAQTKDGLVAIVAVMLMGAGWMVTLTTLNTTAQVTLPRRLRARGMGCYLTAMAFSMATGSILWGRLAGETSLPTALHCAAGVLIVACVVRWRFPLAEQ